MPDVDAALEELRRFADRPPRRPLPIDEVATRARRRRGRRRAVRGVGALVLLVAVLAGVAWGAARGGDTARTVVAGPRDPSASAPAAGPSTEPEPGDAAVWVTDPGAPPSATTSSFTALVTRLDCSGGVTGRVLRPGVVVTDTEVVVRFTAEPLGDDFYTCQGNDWVPYLVDIGQAVGDRAVVDGACRAGGEAEGTAFCNEEAAQGVRWRPESGAITSPLFEHVDTTSPEAQGNAIATGVMPDLRGVALEILGDGSRVLYDLQDLIGQQRTIDVADEAPEGTVIAQDPVPGTPLDAVTGWSLTVSGGGPVVRSSELPADVAAFAMTLPGFDPDEPLTVRATDAGTVYKTDRWLFGLDCAAVDLAYRTFTDPRYDTACPGHIEAPPGS